MKTDISGIKEYVISKSSEDSKRSLVYPFFKNLFPKNFKAESEARGADIYIEGKLIVELKTSQSQWLEGFYQGFHYAKKGLSFTAVCVITNNFIGIWKLNQFKDDTFPTLIKNTILNSDPLKAPNKVGKENANKTSKSDKIGILEKAFFQASFSDRDDIFSSEQHINIELIEFLSAITNIENDRVQINTNNFIWKIEYLKRFYETPIDAVHCFYAILGYWDNTSIVVDNNEDDSDVQVVSHKTGKISENIKVKPRHKSEFKKFIESHYIFTNEGSGLTADYYFSRFDEVLSKIDPEYTKQHGIFFTDINLSKFAMWFTYTYFEKKLGDKYIVFDPAGGSGNLVTSWKGHLKHKIISELQPDLLRTIERRMRLSIQDNSELQQSGFTIIPKISENRGLNFIDRSAEEILSEINKVLVEKNISIDKPFAFLLNPPYKNTDENEDVRLKTDSKYDIHPDIIAYTGNDAGNERYLAFLGQIINLSKIQNSTNPELKPILLIFTPTSWLIPRPTYATFRNEFDKYFKFETGFIITSNEFFKLKGKWPLAFTIWSYNYTNIGNRNNIKITDLTWINNSNLSLNWDDGIDKTNKILNHLIKTSKLFSYTDKSLSIKDWTKQSMFDFKRSPSKTEKNSSEIYGGLPLKDKRRDNKKTYGVPNSSYIGMMDNCTPVRIRGREKDIRFSTNIDRVYFRFDTAFLDVNKAKCLNGFPDQKGYCAYDLNSAQKTFTWFAITKVVNGKYPIWANQMDLWMPKILKESESYFYSLCFAFALSENRCVVTRFEKDNPVVGAPEVFVDNPLSPLNPESFWSMILDKQIVTEPSLAIELVELIKRLYRTFAVKYCLTGIIKNIGLHNEPYFEYFDYPDFLTPNSGLIQIRKFAELNNATDLNDIFKEISVKTKEVKDEIYRLLIDEFEYFE